MGDKSAQYESVIGKLHLWKEKAKENWTNLKERGGLDNVVEETRETVIRKLNRGENNYDHLYRRKTRWELIRISAAIMGIEFSYAAETAFVSPTLLEIGVLHRHMTLIWCLSPLVGFFATPIMGSLSDRCRSNLGRRRPFILALSIGVVLGLLLVPNGKWIGIQLGEKYLESEAVKDFEDLKPSGRMAGREIYNNVTLEDQNYTDTSRQKLSHPWGIFFTVLGTVLLDFDADSCQSPARAYLLDVTVPEDHATGLSTFTVMAGLGGSLGYAVGAIDWGLLGVLFGGHVRLVFFMVLILFVICVFFTLKSFQEIPLDVLTSTKLRMSRKDNPKMYEKFKSEEEDSEWVAVKPPEDDSANYGSIDFNQTDENPNPKNPFLPKRDVNVIERVELETKSENDKKEEEQRFLKLAETSFSQASPIPVETNEESKASIATLTTYLWSIIYMPNSLRILCLTNLFCWMSLVCYSLYFTDFVGEAVFGGDPQALIGSEERELYDKGVRFGCWGMALYSLSCSCYSFVIERLIKAFKAKPVYIGGQLVYTVGMIFMALSRSKWGVLLFSWSAGVMYSTLFTMPYLLVAHYHETDTYESNDGKTEKEKSGMVRGVGTDVGIVSSMVFLAQFILSLSVGSLINTFQTTTVVIITASFLSFCGAISANFVTYLDL